MKQPPEYEAASQRQNHWLYIDFVAENGGAIFTGGPLTFTPNRSLDRSLVITNIIFWFTTTVAITAAQNFLDGSIDGTNWVQFGSLSTTLGSNRGSLSGAGGHFWRYRKTDGVGTITQLIMQFQVQP